MPAEKDGRWWLRCNLELSRARDKPFLSFRRVPFLARNMFGVAPERIRPRHAIQELKLAFARETAKRAVTNLISLFVELAGLQMIAHQSDYLGAHVVSVQCVNVQSIEKSVRWLGSGFFVLARTKTAVYERGRRWFAEVMTKRSQHNSHLPWIIQVVDKRTRAIDNQASVNKDIALRM